MRHLDKIAVRDVREAYLYLTHHAASLRLYRCRAGEHGDVDDFRYEQGPEWPFAFIVNKHSLLWYFRKAGLRNPAAKIAELQKYFSEVKEVQKGEITVRINNIDDARLITSLVFGAATSSA